MDILPVGDVMTSGPSTVQADTTVHDCVGLMRDLGVRHLPVVDSAGRLLGLASDADLLELERQGDAYAPVETAMRSCTRPPSAGGDVVVTLAWQLYDKRGATVVVDEEGRPVGIFTDHDALEVAARLLPEALDVAAVMSVGEPLSAAPELPTTVALERMRARGVKHLLVVDGDEVTGVISHRDLVGMTQATVGRFLGRAVDTVAPDTPARDAIARMQARRISCLPVLEDGRPVGILTRTDLLRALTRRILAADMEPFASEE